MTQINFELRVGRHGTYFLLLRTQENRHAHGGWEYVALRFAGPLVVDGQLSRIPARGDREHEETFSKAVWDALPAVQVRGTIELQEEAAQPPPRKMLEPLGALAVVRPATAQRPSTQTVLPGGPMQAPTLDAAPTPAPIPAPAPTPAEPAPSPGRIVWLVSPKAPDECVAVMLVTSTTHRADDGGWLANGPTWPAGPGFGMPAQENTAVPMLGSPGATYGYVWRWPPRT